MAEIKCRTVDCKNHAFEAEPYCRQCMNVITLLNDDSFAYTFQSGGYRALKRRVARTQEGVRG